eukprot:7766725-Pyramimonas_sp.AAC.1
MAARHQYPRQPTFHVWLKLLTQMPLGIAIGKIESCNAHVCKTVQSCLMTAAGGGDYEPLY